ncbi:hypothetical protein G4X40_18660 [Rhodococcus sp. D2-41]|uniref:hypothetical protein n=1 Tax=Speluncibacter jeojiensis TaxID=2710754 RepID=UPI0024109873|nr:hypothetical protein [Rhodococcus sp. D2-41]MDG3012167.1 hypothetical protein [Rhodococcus sp. D2-41]
MTTPTPTVGDTVTIADMLGTWHVDRIVGNYAGLTRLDEPSNRPSGENLSSTDVAVFTSRLEVVA